MAVIEAISTTYLEADAASVTFSSIPSTYEHLQLRVSSHDSYDAGTDILYARFNSDSGTNYSYHFMEGYSSSTNGGGGINQTYAWLGTIEGSYGATLASTYGGVIVDILDYANTNKNTTTQSISGVVDPRPTNNVAMRSSLWDDTSAVTQIDLYGIIYAGGGFVRGTTFTLYGLNSS
jgi:hypothetical protein|tara:strand:+ start:243 stop:773 length:531 start_codon:yes stop_codon:yes gene_type:complete